MEIILTFEGRIPGQRRSPDNQMAVWEMRSAFDHQLSKLWAKSPFEQLNDWYQDRHQKRVPQISKPIGETDFVPFYGRPVGIGVALKVTLLTGIPVQKKVVEAGDLDNRFKRVIDALRIPKQQEIPNSVTLKSRFLCLLADDDVVSRIDAETGVYLSSDDPQHSFVIVRATPTPIRVTLDNLEMLM